MKILVLTDNIPNAKEVIEQLEIKKIHVVDEEGIGRDHKLRPIDPGYGFSITKKAKSMFQNYPYGRNLVIVMNMQHNEAVEMIDHDISILIYDGSKKRRLFNNPQYKTTYRINGLEDQKNIDFINSALSAIILE